MSLEVIHLKSPLRSLVSRPAAPVDRNTTLLVTSQVMRSRNVSALLVGDQAEAIVTERDLARALANGCQPDTSIATIASFHPITVPATIPVIQAAALMLNDDIRHLVVDLGAGDFGIVSIQVIMAAFLQASDPGLWLEALRIRVHLTPSDCWIG
jgi:signal-transduction protein with cAMP-binding, CBS, and nucleotidyltransferase domain